MKTTTSISTLLLLLCFTTGCEFKGFNSDNDETPTPSPAAVPQAAKLTYQGLDLTVQLNGKHTIQGEVNGAIKLWAAPTFSATPTLEFSLNELALGKIKGQAALAIYPRKDGKMDMTDFYVYTGDAPLVPGKPIVLNKFSHFHRSRVETGIKALPAGDYTLSLKVNGDKENAWDRQYIDATVK